MMRCALLLRSPRYVLSCRRARSGRVAWWGRFELDMLQQLTRALLWNLYFRRKFRLLHGRLEKRHKSDVANI